MILPRSDVVQVAALEKTHYRPRMSLTHKSLTAVFWSGALCLVAKDLEAFGIYAGSPLKRIKARSLRLLELEKQYLSTFGQ